MTLQEHKVATSDDDGVTAKVGTEGHESGPEKMVPVRTESNQDTVNAVNADPADPSDAGVATGDHEALWKSDSAGNPANGDVEPTAQQGNGDSEQAATASAQDAPAAAEGASSPYAPDLSAATVPKDPNAVEPSAEPERGIVEPGVEVENQQAAPASTEAPVPAAAGAGTRGVNDEPAGVPDMPAKPPAANAPEDKAEAAVAILTTQNGTTAETADPEVYNKQLHQAQLGTSEHGKEPKQAQQRADKEPKEGVKQPEKVYAPGTVDKRDCPTQEGKPSQAEAACKGDAQPSTAPPKVLPAEVSTMSASAGVSVASPKSSPPVAPAGTVQALTRRLSSNSISTPPPKTMSEKQLGSTAGSSSTVPGSATGGRSTKSPNASKSAEGSPISTHDTKNTTNVSQLLKLGAFKLQPLKDFVAYEELQRLRVEDGIDATRKEDYLNEEDFKEVFDMDRDAFKKQPAWRQAQAKKKANLF